MRHLHCCRMRLEMIVDPSREDGRFHSRRPRPWKRLHPHVQSQSRGGYRTFCVDTSTAVLHAVVDRFLVNIQTDVVHSLHGGASLVVSESARSLSSAFLHQALLHDLFIQTNHQVGGPAGFEDAISRLVVLYPAQVAATMVSFPAVYKRVVAHWRMIVFLLIFAFCAFPLIHPDKFVSNEVAVSVIFVMLIASQIFWVRRALDLGERFI